MIPLSKRLKTIKDMIPSVITMDVGADHGYLILSLIEEEIIPYGYAVENKKGPYETLVKNINSYPRLKDKITPIFSDGIKDIKDDVKCVVLAGLGGILINNILTKDLTKLKNVEYLVVDAHNALYEVRKKITSLGYLIDDEIILKEDDIYYEIIRFKKGESNYLDDDDYFGPILRKKKDDIYKEKWNNKINEIDNLLNKDLPISRKNELEKEKERILNNL